MSQLGQVPRGVQLGTDGKEPAFGTLTKYIERGIGVSGIDHNDFAFFWDDFIVANTGISGSSGDWLLETVGSGTHDIRPNAAANRGGIHAISSGVTVNSIARRNTSTGLWAHTGTDRWYHAWRFRITTTIDAQAFVGVGLASVSVGNSIMFGGFGAGSTTNFTLQYDNDESGSFADSGIALDTSWHIAESYSLGDSRVKVILDGTSVLDILQANAYQAQICLRQVAKNGTTPTARTLQTDWVLGIAARAT